ncbi:MAG TPA: glycosyltransferase [Candidatus Acidoferrales bacterium]|nr:glycosyltransferase [Candidatus Acidoferrales bacterium]
MVVAPSYPHPGHPYSGVFNERCVEALGKLCETVEVLAPRPYVPPVVSRWMPRWRAYGHQRSGKSVNGTMVLRPAAVVVPRWGGALWVDRAAFFCCRRTARARHKRVGFDAILSFDLLGAGGLAWRIGRELGVPASGWATGSDVRVPRSSSFGRSVARALRRLELVFYQSRELRAQAAALLGIAPEEMPPERHMVLSRGIAEPPPLQKQEVRSRIRRELGLAEDAVLVLNVGRVSRDKGVFELLDAVSRAARHDPRIHCAIVGASPEFDESALVEKQLSERSELKDRVRLVRACAPDKVWEYLCAADIFAFASHREGMPNSLLEAMAMGVAAVAFAIPPVQEIDATGDSLVRVPSFESAAMAREINRLAVSPLRRAEIGANAKRAVLERFLTKHSMATAARKIAELVERRNARGCGVRAYA